MIRHATAALLLLASSAQADDCDALFLRLLVDGNPEVPVVIEATQSFNGAPPTVTRHSADSTGDWLSEAVEPPTLPWSMQRGDVMYMSSDGGQSWSEINRFTQAQRDAAQDVLRTEAETRHDVACSTDIRDGVSYQLVEGRYIANTQQDAQMFLRYWLEDDGWIAFHDMQVRAAAYDLDVTQVLQRVERVDLPTP
ncbi:hypothetical protein ROE7235_00903 [Roseibaca ekhonensis]|jgi:hypothetical protein|uniref:Uncharacterized protein n=1 Tax=Roseinatronobacter ekhonensis TaxID=254356 RepID=A0A3B0MJ87_9RHOB|nr:hypothetical protein [Roseibaca ekhonensis]SUZ31167.1 hypothetical protein ROE7235_00903 [Roseibaca ekhonensis]